MKSKLDMCRKIQLVLTLLLSIYCSSTKAVSLTKNSSFPAVLAFGDSILDTGNNNYLFTFMKGNVWPYGRSMRRPTGRFGNGRVFSDIITDGLGIKKKLPAYRNLFNSPGELKTGVCFASGGAGVDPVTSKLTRTLSPKQQIGDLKGYKRKLSMVAGGPLGAKNIISKAVILVSQGNNDIGITYFGTRNARRRGYNRGSYTRKLAQWNKKFMKDIYDQGGRKFAVMGVIPFGCLPMTRYFIGGFVVFCNIFANRIAEDYNGKLRSGVKSWGRESGFSGAKFVYVDMFNTLMDVIKNYRRYGFSNEKTGCCCMPTSIIPCRNPDKYVFYDFVHPSEKSYKIISKKLVQDIKNGLS